MSGPRGTSAALPGEVHRRPAVLDEAGVVVAHVNEKGDQHARYDFATLPVPADLQRSLAALFAAQVGDAGPWRSIASSREAWTLIGTFARFLAEQHQPPTDIDQISPAVWGQWRVSRPVNSMGERQIRKLGALLRGDPRLPVGTRELTLKQVARCATRETSYSSEQFETIKQIVTSGFRRAWQRISDNRRHLAAWRAGEFTEGSTPWLLGQALDHLARTGDVPTRRRASSGVRLVTAPYSNVLGGTRAEHTWRRLYLSSTDVVCLAALMVIGHGWNATSISELNLPDVMPDPNPDRPLTYRVELEKRRRNQPHRYETRNLTDWGPTSPGRLITRAIEATTPARDLLAAHGAPTTRLLVWHITKPLLVVDPAELIRFGFAEQEVKQWKQAHGDAQLNLRRLRRTVTVLHRRTPTQHTQEVHDSVYVLRDPAAHAQCAPVIAEGITDAIAAAHAVVEARVSNQDSAGHAGMDTATASCGDYTHSPFSPHGAPCRASFLLCLACPNAVITPRHLPRLAYLHHGLDALRAVLPAPVFDHDWREHHTRLTHLRDNAFTAAEWADALRQASAPEKATIDALLRGRFDA